MRRARIWPRLPTLGGTLAMTAWALVVSPAAAAVVAIGPHVGYHRPDEADDGNFLVGGHVQLGPAPILAVQGAVDYRLVESYDLGLDDVEDDELAIRSLPVTATLRVYVPVGPGLSAFGALGAGWYYLLYDYERGLEELGYEDDHESAFGWHLGGGIEASLVPHVDLYLEGRWIFMDPDRDVGPDVLHRVEDLDQDAWFVAAGLSFTL